MAASGRLSTLPPSSLSSLPSSSSSSSSHPPPLLSPKISSFLRSSPSLPFPSLSLVQSPSALRSATPRRTGPRSRSHSSAGSFFVAAGFTTLADAELVPVPKDPLELQGKFPPAAGVYGVYDGDGTLQFVGISRNIAASIAGHAKFVPDLCCSVKLGLVDGTEPDQNVLTDAWKTWMEEHIKATGKVPPGNESGNNTWVRRRPKKSDIRLTPGRHVQLTVPLDELIDRLVKETKIVAFIKGSRNAPQCGFSQRVIGILESHGVDFESVNVLDEEYNSGLRETLKSYSNWPTFPQLFVGGELVGGCDIVTSMAETGELAALFQK